MINSKLAIGDLSQQTTVTKNVATIDTTTSTSNGLLPEHSLAELPLNNRFRTDPTMVMEPAN